MGKIAFVFSGQGDQYPGMGKALYEEQEAARAVFRRFDALRPGTSAQCFTGTEEVLKETKNTQPCLFAMEMSASAVLQERGITPDAVAGFSLGEVAAATFAGMFDMDTGFRLVCKRGLLMQQSAEQQDTAMAAVVKLTAEQVQKVCDQYTQVYPVNFNCPGQITVSGLSAQMSEFCADVKAAGGRAIPLKVKGAFHSPFMQEASTAFAAELETAEIKAPTCVLYANMTAEPYGENAAEILSGQICHPVQWEALVRNMIASGVDTFFEIGPGKTLVNMIKKIDPTVTAISGLEYIAEVTKC